MRLIVTGGAGFIGSHLLKFWNRAYPEAEILNVDKLGYASDRAFESSLSFPQKYSFQKLDLAEADRVLKIFKEFRPDAVIHLAAESHVDNSIRGPEPFIDSNIRGTFHVLEALRAIWGIAEQKSDQPIWMHRLHHVSTDEVFGSLGSDGYFTENTAYSPRSPYSATKAASDHLVRAWGETYNLNYTISNCSNNFGPGQHDEKLIPTIIRMALRQEPIPIYGDGQNVRDWLAVEDHCFAIEKIILNGLPGSTYCVGGKNEITNIDLVRRVCSILDGVKPSNLPNGYSSLIRFVTDRPGHDFRYAIDAEKIQNELGWQPSVSIEERLSETVRWYVRHYSKKLDGDSII